MRQLEIQRGSQQGLWFVRRACWSSAFRLFQAANMLKHELQRFTLAKEMTLGIAAAGPEKFSSGNSRSNRKRFLVHSTQYRFRRSFTGAGSAQRSDYLGELRFNGVAPPGVIQQFQDSASDILWRRLVLNKLGIHCLAREQVRHGEVFDADGHPARKVGGPGSFVEDHRRDAKVSALQSDGAGFRD